MKVKDLLFAIGNVSPEYIEDASPDKEITVRRVSVKWVSLAACLCLVTIIGILAYPKAKPPIEVPPEPPVIETPTDPPIVENPIVPEVENPYTPPENTPVSSGADITPPAIGGSDPTFSRKYIDEVYNIYICDEIVGREASDKWVNEVFLKLSPEEQEALPNVYMMIVAFDISKEALERKNKELGGDELQQSTIDALYLEDVEEIKRALKNPLALYYDGEIYTFDELRAKRNEDIPSDVLSEYFDFIESVSEENGTLKYDLELIDGARALYGIKI